METLIHASWRWYLAIPLMTVGAAGAVWGAKRGLHGLCGAVRGDATQLIPLMEGFRVCIIGLALTGIGAAWAWHLPVLLLLALAIGCGETFETSLILFALRHGAHLEFGRPRRLSSYGAPSRTHRRPPGALTPCVRVARTAGASRQEPR
jgi:hypothetical protein